MKLICVTPQKDKSSLIYLKPDSCLVRNNEDFYIPKFSDHITARVCLVIKIKKMGKQVAERFGHRYYDETTIGLNFVADDVLNTKQEERLPWDEAVGFDRSAPLGAFTQKVDDFTIQLLNDDTIAQEIKASDLPIDKIIAEVTQRFTLKIGDLIYISLPEHSLKLAIGQKLSGTMNDECLLECGIK